MNKSIFGSYSGCGIAEIKRCLESPTRFSRADDKKAGDGKF
jgi:hypothetical protein